MNLASGNSQEIDPPIASPARPEELCRIVVERLVVRDRQLAAID
jgi:hypothetical protein